MEIEDYIKTKFPRVYDFTHDRLDDYDGSHDICHASRVLNNVDTIWNAEISRGTRCKLLAYLAAFTHDTCDKKYGDTQSMLLELNSALKNDRLQKTDIDTIVKVVAHISFSRLRSQGCPKLPTQSYRIWRIVSDADILEAMGATGIVRTFVFQGWKGRDFMQAYDYICSHLFECIDFLNTNCAKKEGFIRFLFMKHFMTSMTNDTLLHNLFKFVYTQGQRRKGYVSIESKIHDMKSASINVSEFQTQLLREKQFGNKH